MNETIENVGSDLEDKLLEALSSFDTQVEAVESLERQLAGAKAAVAESQAALLAIKKLVDSPETRAALAAKPYDGELAKRLAGIQTKNHNRKPTGAVPWKQLRKDGASDAQIRKNVESIGHQFSGISVTMGKSPQIAILGARSNAVIKSGAADVIAAIRRVMRVPLPVKPAAKPAKSKRKATAKKRPSRSKKKATRRVKKAPPAKPVETEPKDAAETLSGGARASVGD